jgi:hypothetical protein
MKTPLLGLAALGLVGCGDNQDPAGADAFWSAIHAAKYTEFTHAPGYATKQPTNAPHGDEVLIYVNDTVSAALDGGKPLTAWPDGALIVKDAYEGGAVTAVAAIEKRAGAWYWAEWSPDGTAKYSGKPDLCVNCHETGGDFVRAFPLPK